MTKGALEMVSRLLARPVVRFQDLADFEKEQAVERAWELIARGGTISR